MKKQLQAVIFSLFFANNSASAHLLQQNQPLPAVKISEDGELIAQNHKIRYSSWQSQNLNGKVRVLFHIAGRSGIKEKNQGLIDAIKAANFDRTKYQTTTIINADDAVIGTGMFVKSRAEEGKLDNTHSQVILDQNGIAKTTWQLKEKENLVVVLDKQGKVQFSFEGKLSGTQIQQIIQLVKDLLTQ